MLFLGCSYCTMAIPQHSGGSKMRFRTANLLGVCIILLSTTVSQVIANSTTMMGAATTSGSQKSHQAATILGVRPQSTWAPLGVKRIGFRIEGLLLKLLTKIDPYHPPDSKLSLRVLWWKSLFGNDVSSPASDGGLMYDLLPGGLRLLVSPWMVWFYPRWVHVIVEIRTAYLDRAVKQRSNEYRTKYGRKVRLITVGGGYDLRSVKLAAYVDEAIELDLPLVVAAKRALLTSNRFQNRRPGAQLPTWYAVDLNNAEALRQILHEILKDDTDGDFHTIFLFEGVLMYLEEGMPTKVLKICRESLRSSGSLICADAIEQIPKNEDNQEVAHKVLKQSGWYLENWLSKGGKTRHMCTARSILTETGGINAVSDRLER